MLAVSADWIALAAKVIGGTLAFIWILRTVRTINPRAVGMMLTFPALNGIVLLTATDKIIGEMVVGIFPLMLFNGFLAALFIALRRRLNLGHGAAYALCLLVWAVIATLLEWRELWPYRWSLAFVSAGLIAVSATWAFRALRRRNDPMPAPFDRSESLAAFLRTRAPRIALFFVSLLLVSVVAHVGRDAHSLVGRLSALPLISLFVLHVAVMQPDVDLGELRIAALLGPPVAGGFLLLFGGTLALVRTFADAAHPLYWLIGGAMLVAGWGLARWAIVGLSRLSYRAQPARAPGPPSSR